MMDPVGPWDDPFWEEVEAARADARWRRWMPPWASRWPQAEDLLWIASSLLLGTNLLLLLAVFMNFVSPLGPLNSSNLLWTALVADLVGVALLATTLWDSGMHALGWAQKFRRAAALLLFGWVGLTIAWRFALPVAAGTNVVGLFTAFLIPGSLPEGIQSDVPTMYNLFGTWIAAASAFAAAHVLLALARRTALPDDWVRGLPTYAWLVASWISLLATVAIVSSLLAVLEGGDPLETRIEAWLVAKMVVAPNVFLSGYASSLHLGRAIRARRAWRESRRFWVP